MRTLFDKLPREEQDAVLNEVYRLLLMRSQKNGLAECSRAACVANIAEIFCRNGMEFEEYT